MTPCQLFNSSRRQLGASSETGGFIMIRSVWWREVSRPSSQLPVTVKWTDCTLPLLAWHTERHVSVIEWEKHSLKSNLPAPSSSSRFFYTGTSPPQLDNLGTFVVPGVLFPFFCRPPCFHSLTVLYIVPFERRHLGKRRLRRQWSACHVHTHTQCRTGLTLMKNEFLCWSQLIGSILSNYPIDGTCYWLRWITTLRYH